MRSSLVVGACALAVVLSGCAAAQPAPEVTSEPPVEGSAEQVDWEAEYGDFIAEFGERPAPVPFEDPAIESARLAAAADRGWENVLASYPTAVRPKVPFVHWTSADEHFDLDSDLNRCLTDAGAHLSHGANSAGKPSGIEASYPPDTATAVAVYACQWLAYPDRPLDGTVSGGWLWDFASVFLVRCLEAHGAPQDPLPTREEHVAAVFDRGYGWVPRFPESTTDVGPDLEVFTTCHGEAV
jgi:hypothetical protein